MKGLLRWFTNSLAFYLALYLVDSVAKSRFHIGAIWVAVLLAVVLAIPNSFIRPFHRTRLRLLPALIEMLIPLCLNTVVMQVFIWAHAPLSATNPGWVLLTAAFLALLAGVLNWLIGFKKKQPPHIITRDRNLSESSRKGSRSDTPTSVPSSD